MKTDINAYGPYMLNLIKGEYSSGHDNVTREPIINLLESLDDIFRQSSSEKRQERLNAHLTHFASKIEDVSCFAPYSRTSTGGMSQDFMNYTKSLGLDKDFLKERGIDLASFSRYTTAEGISTVAYASTRSIFNRVTESYMTTFMKEVSENPQVRQEVNSEQAKERKLDLIISALERDLSKKMELVIDNDHGPTL